MDEIKLPPTRYLLCPNCRNSLSLIDLEYYMCVNCSEIFPILDGIPVLLPTKFEAHKKAEISFGRHNVALPPTSEKIKIKTAFFYDNLSSLLSNHINGKILEFGAGFCRDSLLVKQMYPLYEFFSTDLSVDRLIKGRDLARKSKLSIDYYVACDAENMPFIDSIFNLIYCSSTLHHLGFPEKALSETHRMLKPNGTFCGFNEPMVSKLFSVIYNKVSPMTLHERSYKIWEKTHTYQEWESFLEKSSFKEFKIIMHTIPKYHKYGNKLLNSYYLFADRMPSWFISQFIFSTIHLIAKKK